jgi:hypothetical protein
MAENLRFLLRTSCMIGQSTRNTPAQLPATAANGGNQMKGRVTHPDAVTALDAKLEERLSRRQMLQIAVAGSIAASVSVVGTARAGRAHRGTGVEDPLEEILSRYGSEFGNLNRIG